MEWVGGREGDIIREEKEIKVQNGENDWWSKLPEKVGVNEIKNADEWISPRKKAYIFREMEVADAGRHRDNIGWRQKLKDLVDKT